MFQIKIDEASIHVLRIKNIKMVIIVRGTIFVYNIYVNMLM